jgi:hypothetical protein
MEEAVIGTAAGMAGAKADGTVEAAAGGVAAGGTMVAEVGAIAAGDAGATGAAVGIPTA